MKSPEELSARVAVLESALKEIHRGSIPEGRFLSDEDFDCVEVPWPALEENDPPEGTHWEPYDLEESLLWPAGVASIAFNALAGDRDYAEMENELRAEYNNGTDPTLARKTDIA